MDINTDRLQYFIDCKVDDDRTYTNNDKFDDLMRKKFMLHVYTAPLHIVMYLYVSMRRNGAFEIHTL